MASLLLLGVLGASPAPGAPLPDAGEMGGSGFLAVEVLSPEEACGWEGRSEEEPLPVVFTLGARSLPEAREAEALFDCARGRNLILVVRLEPPPGWFRAPDAYSALAPWLESLDRFLQRRQHGISAFILGDRPEERLAPSSYVFLAEKVGTLIRSLGSTAPLVMGALGSEAGGWLESLPVWRIAPYVQGITLEDSPDRQERMARVASVFPGLQVWIRVRPAGGGEGLLEDVWRARAAGASRVVVAAEGSRAASVRALQNLLLALPSRFVPDPAPLPVRLEAAGNPRPIAFLADPMGPERAVLLPPGGGRIRMTVDSGDAALAEVKVLDLGSGRRLPARTRDAGEAGESRIDLPGVPAPILVRFVVLEGLRVEPERVGVTADFELTAEEIIAGLRAFQAAQERSLEHYTAKASLSYHYRADALNESVDVASLNRFFWKEGVGEYEETELYINGARWKGKAPSLPFVQAEKVKEVPLEIRLDASYRYERAGRETVGERPAYVVRFTPAREDLSLYSGRVWVDAESFAPLQILKIQHGLKAPITSNSDRIEFGWVEGPERRHWLPLRGYRQMVFTVLGRSVAVEREALYEDFEINGADFQERRERAWRSDRPILRDDPDGYSFLVRDGSGGRIRQTESLRNVAVFAGIRLNTSSVLGTPAAGINFFDFDWRGTGTQLDVAFAGPFVNAAWTDPSVAGTPLELSLEGRLIGIRQDMTRATDEGRRNEEEVDLLRQQLFATVAGRLTPFTKAELRLDLLYEDYGSTDRTGEDMVVPSDVLTATSTLRWKYYRAGFLLDVWRSYARRLGWEDWGLTAGASGSASEDSYHKWGAGLLKAFYRGPLQKYSLGLGFYDGGNLDRFSRFRIGDFESVRVSGFNGTDLTFDRGLSGEVGWVATLPGSGFSLGLGLDAAYIENREDFTQEDRALRTGTLRSEYPAPRNDREYLVGGTVGVTFKGPWNSLVRISASQRLAGSLDLSGRALGIRFTLIRTFEDWPWKKRGAGEGPDVAP